MLIDLQIPHFEPDFRTKIVDKASRKHLGEIGLSLSRHTGTNYLTIQEVDDLIYVLQKSLEQYHDTVEAELQAELAKLNNDKDGAS